MEFGSFTSLLSVSLAALIAFVGGFRYVTAQAEALRREILSAQENARLLVDKASESEAKQRHAAANTMQLLIAKVETELRTLQREAVRHEQMNALEARLNTSLSKIEGKVDRLAESVQEIIAIRTKLDSVLSTMTRISDRLDEAGGVQKNTRVV